MKQKRVKRRDLEILAGKLAFLAPAIRPGMAVVRSTYDATFLVKKPHHTVVIKNVKHLIKDWKEILRLLSHPEWIPIPNVIWHRKLSSWQVSVTSDACLSGWGAISPPFWVYGSWPESMRSLHINEL